VGLIQACGARKINGSEVHYHMAHSSSARKRIRQNRKRRLANRGRRSRLRTEIKKLRTALAAGDAAGTRELIKPTLKLVDVSCSHGTVHRNAAARTKSRLARQARALLEDTSSASA
jgi:small subunit ribosomal protein S20